MTLPELEFRELSVNENCLPFAGDTMDVLERDNETIETLKRFYTLFTKVKFEFSSPGNSFRRRVCGEMYKPFVIEKYIDEYSPLLNLCKDNPVLMHEYTPLVAELTQKAVGIKYRVMNAQKLKLLCSSEFANGVILKSKKLNAEGMRIVMDSYLNIPKEILGRLRF